MSLVLLGIPRPGYCNMVSNPIGDYNTGGPLGWTFNTRTEHINVVANTILCVSVCVCPPIQYRLIIWPSGWLDNSTWPRVNTMKVGIESHLPQIWSIFILQKCNPFGQFYVQPWWTKKNDSESNIWCEANSEKRSRLLKYLLDKLRLKVLMHSRSM